MKFALLTVTYGGLFYKGQALTLDQQIHRAKEFGFDALAIETKRPVATEHDRHTTGSIGQRTETTGSTMPYMMSPKKPLNMDCKLGFNPTSSSSCNY